MEQLQRENANMQAQLQQMQLQLQQAQAQQAPQVDIYAALKIPDAIKHIPVYSGEKNTLYQWIHNFRGIMEMVPQDQNNLNFINWMNYIRTRITGPANDALVQRNLPLTVENIVSTLIEFFGDPRDIATLTQQIPYIRQDKKPVQEYYQEVLELSTEISNKIQFVPQYVGHEAALAHFKEKERTHCHSKTAFET
jgi:hypothetical protein